MLGVIWVKKTILLIILSFILISCKNLESVQNKNTNSVNIEKKLEVSDLYESNNLDKSTNKYINLNEDNNLEEKNLKLEKLYQLEDVIKKSFYDGNIKDLDKYISPETLNSYKYRMLKEYDLKETKVYIGNREFLNNDLKELVIMNMNEESFYVELNLQYEGGNWIIKSFSEKR